MKFSFDETIAYSATADGHTPQWKSTVKMADTHSNENSMFSNVWKLNSILHHKNFIYAMYKFFRA